MTLGGGGRGESGAKDGGGGKKKVEGANPQIWRKRRRRREEVESAWILPASRASPSYIQGSGRRSIHIAEQPLDPEITRCGPFDQGHSGSGPISPKPMCSRVLAEPAQSLPPFALSCRAGVSP